MNNFKWYFLDLAKETRYIGQKYENENTVENSERHTLVIIIIGCRTLQLRQLEDLSCLLTSKLSQNLGHIYRGPK